MQGIKPNQFIHVHSEIHGDITIATNVHLLHQILNKLTSTTGNAEADDCFKSRHVTNAN